MLLQSTMKIKCYVYEIASANRFSRTTKSQQCDATNKESDAFQTHIRWCYHELVINLFSFAIFSRIVGGMLHICSIRYHMLVKIQSIANAYVTFPITAHSVHVRRVRDGTMFRIPDKIEKYLYAGNAFAYLRLFTPFRHSHTHIRNTCIWMTVCVYHRHATSCFCGGDIK